MQRSQRSHQLVLPRRARAGELSRRRRGFSWLEVLVVAVILLTLLSLVIPAVQSARQSARNLECMNNLKNLGIALANFQTSHNGRFPALEDEYYGWPVELLPYVSRSYAPRRLGSLRQQGLAVWAGDADTPAVTLPSGRKQVFRPARGESEIVRERNFVCPDDTRNRRQQLGLSYAANCGYIPEGLFGADDPYRDPPAGDLDAYLSTPQKIDWNNDATVDADDADIGLATGIFFRSLTPGKLPVSIEDVSQGDGSSQTICLAENLQSRNYISRDQDEIGFGLAVRIDATGIRPAGSGSGRIGTMAGAKGPLDLGDTDPATTDSYSLADPSGAKDCRPNANRETAQPGQAPRPSSNHRSSSDLRPTINVLYCDGSVRPISEDINHGVYARQLTPRGQLFGQDVLHLDPPPE